MPRTFPGPSKHHQVGYVAALLERDLARDEGSNPEFTLPCSG